MTIVVTGEGSNFASVSTSQNAQSLFLRNSSPTVQEQWDRVPKDSLPTCKIIRSSGLAVRQLSMQGLKFFYPDMHLEAYIPKWIFGNIPSRITTTTSTRKEDWASLSCLIY